ncbi:MFS transporter [Dongia sp.]|uniref:MFS transporter n=1 Tax=Dongia sp. TaxID=1977262 RepID=UPI0037514B31
MSSAVENAQPVRLLRRQNIAPLILVNLGVGLHATIWYMATTAMPSAVEELDAAAYLSWATSLYLMTSILGGAMLPPIKARFGPRNAMMVFGLVVVAGGVLAAIAPNIGFILAGRAIQGLGEGFLLALSYTLVRELFDNALVPRVGGIEAVTWACAVFIGPLLGGWLTDLGSWRLAFFGSGMLPLPMMALGWVILRRHPYEKIAQSAPMLRLLLLAIGVMAIAVADRLSVLVEGEFGPLLGFAAVPFGIVVIALTFALDRRSRNKLFPTAFPGFRHPACLGIWVLALMALSEAAVYVYGPYILQIYRGLTPTWAGYFGAIHAIAWSLTAMLVAPLGARWHDHAIIAGPTLLAIGLAGLAFTLATSPLPIIAIAMVPIGCGFGISYSFLSQRIMGSADPGEEDATIASMSTIFGMGGAISAAVSGLVGNSIGLDRPLTVAIVEQASLILYGGGALLAGIGILFAWRIVRVYAVHPRRAA